VASRSKWLTGDEVRQNLSKGLGFSRENRDTNIRRIGYVAKLLTRKRRCGDHGRDLALPRDPGRGTQGIGAFHRGVRESLRSTNASAATPRVCTARR